MCVSQFCPCFRRSAWVLLKFDVDFYKKPVGRIKLWPKQKTSSHLDKTEHRSITFFFSKLFHGTKVYVRDKIRAWLTFYTAVFGTEGYKTKPVTLAICVRLYTFMAEWVFVKCTGRLPGSLTTHSSYVEFGQ